MTLRHEQYLTQGDFLVFPDLFNYHKHYGAFYGCRKTRYIQRVLFLPPQMCDR